ncbi:hypothetical protein [Desulfuromonas thiophila]|uniref:Uncharacterized protein n=1 Tax=Desulfuromonas thiophila TaxID=57664 RepID=A0A1G7DXV3_9BACT|nr:hypothetical protein [Desulfuromonas thiophila]SDE56100.1 hypothetical protein SAMN05661003_11623 [Desulfuromonas thiophila]
MMQVFLDNPAWCTIVTLYVFVFPAMAVSAYFRVRLLKKRFDAAQIPQLDER